MKKLLLTLAGAAALSFGAYAQSESFNVNDATDINGTFTEETKKDDGSVQAAAHYQPLVSFTLGNYKFEFSTTNDNASSQPAYYYATSTNANQQKTVRIYNGTTMKVTAPAGVTMSKIEFTGSNLGNNAAFTVDNGSWTTNNNAVWTGSANSISVTANASWRFSALKIYTGEGGDNPSTPVEPADVYTVAQALAMIAAGTAPDSEVSVKGVISNIQEISTSYGNATYTIVDEGSTEGLLIYRGYWLDGAKFTATDQLAVGAEIVVSGKLVDYNGTYEMTTGSKVISYNGEGGSQGGGDTPEPTPKSLFEKTTTITSGAEYILAVGEELCTAVAPTLSYGRFNLTAATFNGNNIEADDANAIVFTEGDDGYTMKDAAGRYLAMDSEHLTTFQMFTELNEGCYWVVKFEADGTIRLTNNLTEAVVSQTKGTNGTWYTNAAPAVLAADTEYNLPTLYKKIGAGVANVAVADENAPVEYFNLQGVRVANPENGLYIRRQGNTVTNVLVK